MTGPLVAPELVAALAEPWGLADSSRRAKAVKVLPPDSEQRARALSALEACFAYMIDVKARHGEEPSWGLPDEFYEDHWFILQIKLKKALPTLADVTPEKVRAFIQTELDPGEIFGATWTTPPDEVVEDIGRTWAFYIVNGATENLVRWLRGPAREHFDASERTRLIGLFKESAPRLPWRLAILAVPGIRDVGGPAEKEYLDRLASDQSVHEKTRAEAENVSLLIDRQSEPG